MTPTTLGKEICMAMGLTDRCFIVAEISANHNQVYQRAVALIYAAARAGADAVKVQMYTPDSMTLNSKDNAFRIKDGLWAGQTLYELYSKACMPYEWVPDLKKLAEGLGLFFFTSVYDLDTVDIAEEMGIGAYKIASFENDYYELIEKVAKTGKPIVISSGGATLEELLTAYATAMRHNKDVTVLKCVSAYPTRLEDMNLNTLSNMKAGFKKIGVSDHTTGLIVPMVSIALGAQMIEKHLDLDGKGVDGAFSLTPDRFHTMVQTVRAAEKSLGSRVYEKDRKYHRKMVKGRFVRTVC